MSGGRPTTEEMLRIERGTEVPDSELTPTSRIRRMFFRGEVVDPREVSRAFGAHPSLPSQTVNTLKKVGFVFEHVARDGSAAVCYRMTNPDFEPSDDDFAVIRKLRSEESKRKREKATRAAKTKTTTKAVNATTAVEGVPPGGDVAGRDDGIPPLPDLGQPVTVYALALNDDGTITLGLRNGSRRWVSTITGTIE